MEVSYLEVVLFLYGVFITVMWVSVCRRFAQHRMGTALFMRALAENKVSIIRDPVDGSVDVKQNT